MNTLQQKIVDYLKPELKKKNITYAKLAHSVNLSEQKVKNIFGCRSSMTIQQLKVILEVLELPLTLIIGNVTIKL